LINLSNYNF